MRCFGSWGSEWESRKMHLNEMLVSERSEMRWIRWQTIGAASYPFLIDISDRLLLNCLRDLPCHIDTAGRCMGKGMGNAAAVTDDVESIMTGHQVVIHFHLHVVEFNLHSIKKSVIICRTRCHLIQGINHLDNTVQNPFWENQAQITGSRIEGWNRKRFIDSLLRASFSAVSFIPD